MPLFHPCGEVLHEIMAKYPGNAQQQHDIHAGTFEHLVHVALVTGNLAGKPFHFYALPLQFRCHHSPDMQFRYLLFFCHKKIRELLFCTEVLDYLLSQTRKPTENPQAFQLSFAIVHEMVEVSVQKEKRKRFFANMSNYLFVMFYIFGFKLVKILLLF